MRRKLQRINHKHLLFLDETAVRLSEAPTSTLVLPGQQPFVIVTETTSYARRFDMIACVAGDTQLLPKIFTVADRTAAGVKGINESMLLSFIDDTLAQAVEGLDRYPLTLVLDRASIHNEEKMMEAFHDRSSESIKSIEFMPPMGAKRLSPLDNSLFHVWKERIRSHGPLTLTNLQQVMCDEWNNIPARTIKAQYHHCGLMRGQDPYLDCTDPSSHQH